MAGLVRYVPNTLIFYFTFIKLELPTLRIFKQSIHVHVVTGKYWPATCTVIHVCTLYLTLYNYSV